MIDQCECFQVPSDASRVRLDHYLSRLLPSETRSQIQGWIRSGAVLVNDVPVKTGYLLHSGDTITVHSKPASPHLEPQPENIPLSVVYEDKDIAVIDKPAGLVCHAGAGVRSGTLVNALLYHLGALQTEDVQRPGIVHRLDKLTSGLLVVAKTLEAHRNLARQFKSRQVRKEYLALVYGSPIPAAGTIDAPLGRDRRDRKKISVHSRRSRNALTHYHLKRECGPFSLLELRIETGRTHQIRVHLAHIGHPIVGDIMYGGNRSRNLFDPRLRRAVAELKRQFLHAARLEFQHPRTGESLAFVSPLPVELSDFLAFVAAGSRRA